MGELTHGLSQQEAEAGDRYAWSEADGDEMLRGGAAEEQAAAGVNLQIFLRRAEAEAVPPYAVFTNEQLAAMVTGRVADEAGLAAIDGVGPARVERYGARFVAALQEAWRAGEGGG